MRHLTLWPRCRMRILTLRFDPASPAPQIRAVARADVVSHPLLGCAGSAPMSALRGPAGQAAVPFEWARLVRAVQAPVAPDMMVFVHAGMRRAIPDEVLSDLPCINIRRAAARVSPGWSRESPPGQEGHGKDPRGPDEVRQAIEYEVASTVEVLLTLLQTTSPEELAWLSRKVDA